MIWDKYGYLTGVPGPATEAFRLPYPSHPLDRVPQAVQTRVEVQVYLLRFYHLELSRLIFRCISNYLDGLSYRPRFFELF